MNRKSLFFQWIGILVILGFLLSAFGSPATVRAGAPPKPPVNHGVSAWTRSGWFSIVWGDSIDGKSHETYYLTDDDGNMTTLVLDEGLIQSLGGALSFDRKRVTVQGAFLPSQANGMPVANVSSMDLVSAQNKHMLDSEPIVSGSKPWVSIMCKFSDKSDEPKNLAYFQGMYANTYPGLDHYWRQVSYDTANVAGSGAFGWFTMPHTAAYYNPTGAGQGTDLDLLAADCIGVADSSVNFSLYTGINMMFNFDFDYGVAWGGGQYLTLDGVTKFWSTTWEPPWGYSSITVMSHEMGHGFGLPHSSGNYGQTYDNRWDVMSDTWSDCANSTDPTYGCLGQHTIAYHKDILGWVPSNQKYTPTGGTATITLEQLAQPQTGNYLMAQIQIGGSSTHFYTVEARRTTGYDVKLPGQAVIIHEVDTTRGRPAYVIDSDGDGDTGDEGAMWVVGETFTDAANGISVEVLSATATGFQVSITASATVQPDLVIDSISVVPANPAPNQTATYTVRVRNQGNANVTSAFWVDMFVDGAPPTDCSGTGVKYWSVTSLNAGAYQDLTTTMALAAGTHSLYAHADTNCDIPESDENDNILGPINLNVVSLNHATVNQSVAQLDPTTRSPINFTATFSNPIDKTTLTSGDITLGGTAGATTASITEIAPKDGTTFRVSVSGMTDSGTVIASIGANKVTDLSGNSNSASTSTDKTVTYYKETDTLCANVPVVLSGENKTNNLVARDDIDPYKFEIIDPYTTIVATLITPVNGDFALNLYNTCVNNSWVSASAQHIGRRYIHIGPGGASETEVRFNVGKATGTFYLAVSLPTDGLYDAGNYTLHLELEPPDFGLFDTLILYNPSRFKTKYGLEAASQTMDRLTQLAANPKVNGMILQLDQFPNVVSSYSAWDNTTVYIGNEKANVTAANAVSSEIRKAMQEFMQANKKLVTGYVVIVGDDDQIPFRRLNIVPDPFIGDPNWFSEKEYFQSLGDIVNTPIDAALMTDQTLSDDFYGDYYDRLWTGSMPGLSVGRLLDTPTRINKVIDLFLNNNGEVDLTVSGSGVIAGADLLVDSAQQVCDLLNFNGGLSMDCALISPPGPNFTSSGLSQKFIGDAHNISGYYGHTNHGQMFVPSGAPLTSDEISSANFSPVSSLWWVIGCQSGLVMPNSENQPLSLAQALGDHGVTYLGNTGWAWGSDGPLTYSELLYNLVIKRLRVTSNGSVAIGDALRLAKQEYFYRTISTGSSSNNNYSLSYYDGKIMAEATLYGLPMLRFKLPQETPPDAGFMHKPLYSQLDTTGLYVPSQFHSVTISPHNLVSTSQEYNGNTFFIDGSGNYNFTPSGPLLPQSEYFNFETSLGQAKGVIWLGGIYNVQNNNPLVIKPAQLNDAPGLENDFTGIYPLIPVALANLENLDGTFANHLTFQTGQFIGNETSGTLRLFSDMEFLVGLWSGVSSDNTLPAISGLNMATDGYALDVDLPVSDASGIYKAYMTFTDGNGVWQSVELSSGSPACSLGTQTYSITGMPLTTGMTSFFIQVMDCAGNVAMKLNNGQYFNVSSDTPFVASVTRANPNPASSKTVDFTVTFSEAVTGVDTSAPFGDFALRTSGVVDVSIIAVTPLSSSSYQVTVNTGSGNGTIQLNVLDDDSIQDSSSSPIGGPGAGNGNFTVGEVYNISKMNTATFKSTDVYDGWILEYTENSNIGRTINSTATTLFIGDDVLRRQYRSILSFNTSILPDTAVITKVTLKLRQQAIVGGGNPVTMFQGFMTDIKRGIFGTSALQVADWQAVSQKTLGPFTSTISSGWYSLDLTAAKDYINKTLEAGGGLTQIRLRFKLDDNNNSVANYLSLFSGNAAAASRPQLIIEYYAP